MTQSNRWPSGKIAVIGFARTGEAVARIARDRGNEIVVIDDHPSDRTRARASELSIDLVVGPSPAELHELVRMCSYVVVSPGVPPSHPIFAIAAKSQLISEIELAYLVSTVPIVAITGTNGKTTVTTLVDEILTISGLRSTAAGNIGPTLIDAAVRDDLDYIVAEVSSFQLALTHSFRPKVATWLNFAEDHLDWHPSIEDYAYSKSKIFHSQGPEDVAILNFEDDTVMSYATDSVARVVTFGESGADYFVYEGQFFGPDGEELGAVNSLARSLPHDVENALAALATAREAGASPDACRAGIAQSRVLAHRVEYVANIDGIDLYDDSKATTPSAVLAALRGFPSVVLIAGGRNKGLDLSVLRSFADESADHLIRGVVGIGEAGETLVDLFHPDYPVIVAHTMDEAVEMALSLAVSGDVVLLSPGCASFDWYESYEQRGEDFVRSVDARIKRSDQPSRREGV